MRNFCVNDGLASLPSEAEAIDVLRTSQEVLAKSNIRLHKTAANSSYIMQAFPAENRTKELKDLDLPLPLQRSIGFSWNKEMDHFSFFVSREEKPVTRRGILPTVNSLFDPLGFVVAVTTGGRNLMKGVSVEKKD